MVYFRQSRGFYPHFSASQTALHHGLHLPAAVLPSPDHSRRVAVRRRGCDPVLPQLTAQPPPQPGRPRLPESGYQGQSCRAKNVLMMARLFIPQWQSSAGKDCCSFLKRICLSSSGWCEEERFDGGQQQPDVMLLRECHDPVRSFSEGSEGFR